LIYFKTYKFETQDLTLTRHNLFCQIDRELAGSGIQLSDWLKRKLVDSSKVRASYVDTFIDLKSVEKVLEFCDQHNPPIPYEVVRDADGVIECLYMASPEFICSPETVCRIRIMTHDTTFAFVDPKSGYERVSFFASVEPGGVSQPLIVGFSKSDHSLYFAALLRLFLRVFGHLIVLSKEQPLLIVSDEDRAWIKACVEVFGKDSYLTAVCTWHKAKSFLKKRETAATAAGEFALSSSEDEKAGEGGDEEEE
jgi:hypothetical protein